MSITRTRVAVVAVAATAALAIGASPALAADSVTQAVTAGSRTASVANLTLGSVAYSHSAQTPTGSMTLTADDSSGSNAGWNVTVLTSAFVWTVGTGGASTGTDIPAANFTLTSAAAPAASAGQAIDLDTDGAGVDIANGPMVPAASPVGTLDAARKALQANPGFGKGTYTQALGVSLLIPAQSAAGTYTGTLTTTVAAAP